MLKTVNTKRIYKASIFSSLFSKYLDELPKAVSVSVPPDIKIEDVSLDDVLFMEQINDVALWVGSVLWKRGT